MKNGLYVLHAFRHMESVKNNIKFIEKHTKLYNNKTTRQDTYEQTATTAKRVIKHFIRLSAFKLKKSI